MLPVLAAACMSMTVPSYAQNRGVYPLGMSAINSGVMPESTFTYSNQFLLYTRDQAKDKEGQTLPVTGNHSVILDMNTITWMSKERILFHLRHVIIIFCGNNGYAVLKRESFFTYVTPPLYGIIVGDGIFSNVL